MTRHRYMLFCAALGLALLLAAQPAQSHPAPPAPASDAAAEIGGLANDPIGASPATGAPSRHHRAAPLSWIAGGLVLLAALPNRRRTLVVALVLGLGVAALEGAGHAALHLGHVDHDRGLAIDASAIPPAVVAADAAILACRRLPAAGRVAAAEDPLTPAPAAASARGRAPPSAA